jgi:hypothetical protein
VPLSALPEDEWRVPLYELFTHIVLGESVAAAAAAVRGALDRVHDAAAPHSGVPPPSAGGAVTVPATVFLIAVGNGLPTSPRD